MGYRLCKYSLLISLPVMCCLYVLGAVEYGFQGSIAWVVILSTPILGPTVWISDLFGKEFFPNLFWHVFAGSILLALILVYGFYLVFKRGSDPATRRVCARVLVACLSIAGAGACYMAIRTSIMCVPEVALSILGATPEDAALQHFRWSTGLDRGDVKNLPRSGEHAPSIKEFLVCSQDGQKCVQIGVARVKEYRQCHGWELAYSETQ